MRRHHFYSGRVQGVGFRFTAQRIARGLAVTGWVQNLPDGRVELMVEGDSEAVEAFASRLAETMDDHIDSVEHRNVEHRNVEHRNEAETGEFDGFEIRD